CALTMCGDAFLGWGPPAGGGNEGGLSCPARAGDENVRPGADELIDDFGKFRGEESGGEHLLPPDTMPGLAPQADVRRTMHERRQDSVQPGAVGEAAIVDLRDVVTTFSSVGVAQRR